MSLDNILLILIFSTRTTEIFIENKILSGPMKTRKSRLLRSMLFLCLNRLELTQDVNVESQSERKGFRFSIIHYIQRILSLNPQWYNRPFFFTFQFNLWLQIMRKTHFPSLTDILEIVRCYLANQLVFQEDAALLYSVSSPDWCSI